MHRSGIPSGVSQSVLKGRLWSLHQTRLGALNKNVDNQASNHEIGIESSHPSHCASDIPKRCRLVRALGMNRSALVGPSLCSWA